MSNCITKTNLEQMVLVICAPGITKKDVKVQADEENKKLIVVGKSSLIFPELVKDEVDLEIHESFEIPPTFSPISADVVVDHGMIIITLSTAEHIKTLDVN